MDRCSKKKKEKEKNPQKRSPITKKSRKNPPAAGAMGSFARTHEEGRGFEAYQSLGTAVTVVAFSGTSLFVSAGLIRMSSGWER